MAIEVRIPTILRTYTDGEKAVRVEGSTLAQVIDNLDTNHPGIGERLMDGDELRRFVNVYINDEDVRFIGSLDAAVSDGDQVVVLPAVAGGSGNQTVLGEPLTESVPPIG
ncbi:MAG: MoaD/ThiS family protein [Nocardioides sp.]|nr:MoaD/ThiS family protein [Nocardioides sp.]